MITAVVTLNPEDGFLRQSWVGTSVKMRAFPDEEVQAYVATGEPMDKAGGYAIQGRAGAFIEAVDGCYSNVVGFPMCEIARMLTAAGVPLPTAGPVCLLPSGAPCPRLRSDLSAVPGS